MHSRQPTTDRQNEALTAPTRRNHRLPLVLGVWLSCFRSESRILFEVCTLITNKKAEPLLTPLQFVDILYNFRKTLRFVHSTAIQGQSGKARTEKEQSARLWDGGSSSAETNVVNADIITQNCLDN